MKMRLFISILCFNLIPLFASSEVYSQSDSESSLYVAVSNKSSTNIDLSSSDDSIKRIVMRNELERQGGWFAERRRYKEALEKYQQALNPKLLNHKYEGASARGAIIDIYQRMGNFEVALKKHLERKGPNDGVDWPGADQELELNALIEARDSGSRQPIYGHIEYLKRKYKNYIPPPGDDSGYHGIPIEMIMHLYDYLGDARGGINFMKYVLTSKKISKGERHAYEQVKAAFEEDERTGQKGHLQKVIEESTYIGW